MELIEAAADAEVAREVVEAATATVRLVDEDVRPQVASLGMAELVGSVPDQLLEVRRPSSYQGQRNYVGTIVAPTQLWEYRPAWCESLQERYQYLDVLICHPVVQMGTQAMRLEWWLPSGVRMHYPDGFFLLADGRRLVVDVTTKNVHADPRQRAVFEMTRRTCEVLGWDYQLRSAMPAQRMHNVSFLRCYMRPDIAGRQEWRQQLRYIPLPTSLLQLARLYGDGDASTGLSALWTLVAGGDIHAPLSEALRPETTVHRGRSGMPVEDWVRAS